MILKRLPFSATLDQYGNQAEQLLAAHSTGDSESIRLFHQNHPRFLDPTIPWLSRNLPDSEIQKAALEIADAQLTIARWYNFQSWGALVEYIEAVTTKHSTTNHAAVFQFESAVEAVINGDLLRLKALLSEDPDLVRARSTRITNFEAPLHRATLLHYVAANGVEGYRQQTPQNAVQIATALLQAGADVDALADFYGGQYATMSLLVSSSPPAQAGLQIPLMNTLLDFGAALEARGSEKWGSPLMTALAFGFLEAAEELVRRGARVDDIGAAAGLGLVAAARQMLPTANGDLRHRALTLAAQNGHVEIVRLLLDAGEDPNRYNPEGNHAHTTPLHQAVFAGREAVVQLLVERGARVDIKDTIYHSTPLGWAMYAGRTELERYLRTQGAK